MVNVWGTGAVLAAPPAPLLVSGYSPGNTLPSQYWNWLFFHITKELNNVLAAAGIAQNASVDTQLASAIFGWTTLSSGSPYSAALSNMVYAILATTNPYVFNLPASTGSGKKIKVINYSGLATGLVQIAPNGSDNIGAAGNVSVYLQNVDQSGFVYKYQWIELTDTVAGTWDVTGGQFCPHQAVDTDGQQYHLGRLHHLPLGNATSRSISGVPFNPPNVSNWSAAIQVTGSVGVPAGAKAVRLKVFHTAYAAAGGEASLGLNYSDNTANIPSFQTAHPMTQQTFYASAAGQYAGTVTEIDVPLNASGQFFVYTSSAVNLTIASCNIYATVVGYYMGD